MRYIERLKAWCHFYNTLYPLMPDIKDGGENERAYRISDEKTLDYHFGAADIKSIYDRLKRKVEDEAAPKALAGAAHLLRNSPAVVASILEGDEWHFSTMQSNGTVNQDRMAATEGCLRGFLNDTLSKAVKSSILSTQINSFHLDFQLNVAGKCNNIRIHWGDTGSRTLAQVYGPYFLLAVLQLERMEMAITKIVGTCAEALKEEKV